MSRVCIKKALALGTIGLIASPLFAAEAPGHWYVVPQGGAIWTDDERNVEDKDWLIGLGVGKQLSDAFNLELNLTEATLHTAGGTHLDLFTVSADLLRVWGRQNTFSPYLTGGVGSLRNDFRSFADDDSSDLMLQAGVGAMVRLWESASGAAGLALRPEVKARFVDVGAPGHYVDYVAMLGVQFSFGAPTPPAPVVAATPPPPPPPAPPPPVAPQPVDSDGDGVFDDADRCPNTARGVAVDEFGCERKGSVVLEGVTFETNSEALTASSRPVLDRVAESIRKYPRLRIEMQGHTDSTGTAEYNQSLSQRRADSVAQYLESAGVPRSQIAARGYGETQPIADNTTAAGRSQNRRVVMSVVSNPGEVKVEGSGTL